MKKTSYLITLISLIMAMQMTAQTKNETNRDFNNNQMHIVTTDNNVHYYNTKGVAKVRFEGNKTFITSTGKSSDDIYDGNASSIGFSLKAQPLASGQFSVATGHVEITEAKGWQESLYLKWAPFAGAEAYNVYVKGGQYTEYTRIDRELVRDYGSYARADIPGLSKRILCQGGARGRR